MKTIQKIISIALGTGLLATGLTGVAEAQRGHYGGRVYGRSGVVVRVGPAHPYYRGGVSVYRPRPVMAPRVVVGGYSPYYGPRYFGLPHGSVSLTFGGNPYFYVGGTFYRPFGGYYRSVFPPVGLRIRILPPGYTSFYLGPDPYYFYNGIYYRPYASGGYEVTDAPMGATLHFLPKGARQVVVNGESFYELNGTYYKESQDNNGNTLYTVVGKHGEINNTPGDENGDETSPAAPRVGDRVGELPADTRVITLNGETLYVAPDDTYYRKDDDGAYTIVGIAGVENTPDSSGGGTDSSDGPNT